MSRLLQTSTVMLVLAGCATPPQPAPAEPQVAITLTEQGVQPFPSGEVNAESLQATFAGQGACATRWQTRGTDTHLYVSKLEVGVAQLTIYIPDELELKIRERAQREGKSLSAFVAEIARNAVAPDAWSEAFGRLATFFAAFESLPFGDSAAGRYGVIRTANGHGAVRRMRS